MFPKNVSFRNLKIPLPFAAFLLGWGIYFAVLFSRAFYLNRWNTLVASHTNFWGDWSIHFTMGSAMAIRDLILDSSPLLLGAPFRYPFFVNFLSALLIRAGVPFYSAFTVPSFLFVLAFLFALYWFYAVVFRSERVAFLSSCLFLLNGGMGFLHFIKDIAEASNKLKTLFAPPRLYTHIEDLHIHWISVIDSMIIPQRSFQLGFPWAVAVLILVYKCLMERDSSVKVAVVGGLLFGFLPIIHAHSFLAAGIILGFWMTGIFFTDPKIFLKRKFKLWLVFGGSALIVALPLIRLFILPEGGGGTGLKWFPGWYAREENINWFVFWWRNWGITPLVAMWGWLKVLNRKNELPLFTFFVFLPFFVLFALVNLVQFQPWLWDNTKLLVWVSLGFSGLAGYAVSSLLWGKGK